VSFGDVVEGHDIVAELAQEVCAESDDGREGKLDSIVRILLIFILLLGSGRNVRRE
jgi:hypothetical protein